MKTLVALIFGLVIGGMLGGSYAIGCREQGRRQMEREAVNRGNGQWQRTGEYTSRFQWITHKHSSVAGEYPDDYFIANDEPTIASR